MEKIERGECQKNKKVFYKVDKNFGKISIEDYWKLYTKTNKSRQIFLHILGFELNSQELQKSWEDVDKNNLKDVEYLEGRMIAKTIEGHRVIVFEDNPCILNFQLSSKLESPEFSSNGVNNDYRITYNNINKYPTEPIRNE